VGIELNPGPRRGKHLSEEDRWRVVFMTNDLKLSSRDIAKKMKISQSTVLEIQHKYNQTKSVHDLPGRGRKRKLTEKAKSEIVKAAKKRKSAPQIQQNLKKKVSVRTIQRTIKKGGLFYLKIQKIEKLTESQKQKRVEYSKEMKDYEWKNVLFSDEKSFWLGRSPGYAWQSLKNRITEEVSKHTPKLHVWGAIGYHVKSKLYYFEENMTATLYQSIIKASLPDKHLTYSPNCPKKLVKKWVFLQDNDPKHKAKKSMQTLQKLVGDRLIAHPPMSPDLNPMEDIWSYLDRKVKESKCKTISSLKRVLTKEWNSLQWKEIRSSVDSMERRLTQCIDSGGQRLKY
jgi:transposase